jgi:hypothetical protein
MNRIYQGKVTKVELRNVQGEWEALPKAEWQTALWQHHQLFQDAVNYYTLALAALAEGLAEAEFVVASVKAAEDRAASDPTYKTDKARAKAVEDARQTTQARITAALDWQKQVCATWNSVSRKGETFLGPHARVAPLLGLDPSRTGFADCARVVLQDSAASPTQRAAALLRLLDLAEEASDLSQLGVDKLPWLCSGDTKKKTDDATKSKKARQAQEFCRRLRGPEEGEFDPTLFVTQATGEVLTGNEAKKALKRYFKAVATDHAKVAALADRFDEWLARLPVDFSIQSPGRRYQSVYPYAVLYKYWRSHPEVVEAFQVVVESRAKGKDVAVLAADPLKEARTASDRRHFDYFTNIAYEMSDVSSQPATRDEDEDGEAAEERKRAVWFDFDLAAFVEAIKAPHRYFQDSQKRAAEVRKIEAKLKEMDRRGAEGDQEDDGEEEAARFGFEDDTRIDLLRKLVSDPIDGLAWLGAAETPDEQGKVEQYTIQQRTLRGWGTIRDEWRKLAASEDWPRLTEEQQQEKLWNVVKAEQGEHRDDFGSATLYKQLTKSAWHPIWRDPPCQPWHCDDPLRAWREYQELRFELENKKRAIRFTPAHAEKSPRYFHFPKEPAKTPKKAGKRPPKPSLISRHEPGNLAFTAGIILDRRPVVVRITYSAPRLYRDELRTPGDTDLYHAPWMQPMLQALTAGESPTVDAKKLDVQNFANCRITLQPSDSENIQLTFPVDVSADNLIEMLGKKNRWLKQFGGRVEGDGKKKTFIPMWLSWPHEPRKAESKPEKPWRAALSRFACIAIDLGQRHAGAFARLDVRANDDFGGKPSRFIGPAKTDKELDVAWRAAVESTGMLRLPGEDRWEWHGAFREELHGERGRNARDFEKIECARLFREFGILEADLLPAGWRDKRTGLSFPEQNDKLLVAARRAMSHVARLHRWCWFLAPASDDKQAAKAFEEVIEADESGVNETWKEHARHARRPELFAAIQTILDNRLKELPPLLVTLANRILPLREKTWRWDQFTLDRNGPPHRAVWPESGEAATNHHEVWLRGQRGLSLKRIEQIEELRRRFQALNHLVRRIPGTPPANRRSDKGVEIPDPCPDILDKLSRLKEQRVFQTAHMILAEALGVRLAEPPTSKKQLEKQKDVHGVYKAVRPPVDFIVIEDLSRYRASQGRAPRENSRLMKWCHRAVRDKLKQLCEPFGIPVIETPAAWSSRFCSRSGSPGFRAVEVHPRMKDDFPWGWMLKRLANHRKDPGENPLKPKLRAECERIERLFQQLDELNRDIPADNPRPQWRTLLAPMAGGPIFVPLYDRIANPDHPKLQPAIVQADINAAINLGLRAIADPRLWSIHSRLRTRRLDSDEGKTKQGAREEKPATDPLELETREKRKFGDAQCKLKVEHPSKALRESRANPNFFAVPAGRKWPCAEAGIEGNTVRLVSGQTLWGIMKRIQWWRVEQINARRLKRLAGIGE